MRYWADLSHQNFEASLADMVQRGVLQISEVRAYIWTSLIRCGSHYHTVDRHYSIYTYSLFCLYMQDGKRVEVASSGEVHYSFLCALLWPFIDSYYAVGIAFIRH